MRTIHRVSVWFSISIAAIFALSAVALLLLPAQAVQALPPRPTLPLEPTSAPGPAGGTIELHAQFPSAWPWSETDWQDLWTVVQWQDDKGVWHDVDGWQGTLDTVKAGEDGEIMGQKTWWVGASDLGKGPFRWQVYRSKGGELLAISKPFDLPDAKGAIVTVEVSLAP